MAIVVLFAVFHGYAHAIEAPSTGAGSYILGFLAATALLQAVGLAVGWVAHRAVGDLALRAGIESIIGNFDAAALHLWRRIGCEVEILGSTSRYGRPVYLGLHPISDAIVTRIKKKLKGARSAFAEARVMAA